MQLTVDVLQQMYGDNYSKLSKDLEIYTKSDFEGQMELKDATGEWRFKS